MIVHEPILEQYEKHFKFLRILNGIDKLKGDFLLEAETEDGRHMFINISPNEQYKKNLKKVLESWSPDE